MTRFLLHARFDRRRGDCARRGSARHRADALQRIADRFSRSASSRKKGKGTGLGAVAGGVLGGVLGHQIGSGTGRTVATDRRRGRRRVRREHRREEQEHEGLLARHHQDGRRQHADLPLHQPAERARRRAREARRRRQAPRADRQLTRPPTARHLTRRRAPGALAYPARTSRQLAAPSRSAAHRHGFSRGPPPAAPARGLAAAGARCRARRHADRAPASARRGRRHAAHGQRRIGRRTRRTGGRRPGAGCGPVARPRGGTGAVAGPRRLRVASAAPCRCSAAATWTAPAMPCAGAERVGQPGCGAVPAGVRFGACAGIARRGAVGAAARRRRPEPVPDRVAPPAPMATACRSGPRRAPACRRRAPESAAPAGEAASGRRRLRPRRPRVAPTRRAAGWRSLRRRVGAAAAVRAPPAARLP